MNVIKMKCEYCGCYEQLVHHHVKYKELHGVDEVIILCRSCHEKLHNKLRRENGCHIRPDILHDISRKAYFRRPDIKKKYNKHTKEYRKNLKQLDLSETIMPNIRLRERIVYNTKTGLCSITSGYQPSSGKKILFIDI